MLQLYIRLHVAVGLCSNSHNNNLQLVYDHNRWPALLVFCLFWQLLFLLLTCIIVLLIGE